MEWVYSPIILTAKAMFRALGLRMDVQGSDHVPRTGGAVLASSHTSFLDFIFVGVPADEVGGRLVRFMAKDAVFHHPVAGPLMRGMKHIPVDRDAGADAYREAVAALRRGELVGVFPEATMSRSMELKEFKNGAARMAAEAGVPLVPVIVFGGARLLSYGHRDLHHRGRPLLITVGEPLHPAAEDDPTAITVELKARMTVLLDETLARYPQPPTSPDDAWWWPARLGGTAPTLDEAAQIEVEVKARKAAARAAKKR